MQYENWHLLLFLTTLLSFALLSIYLLSLAVWSNIRFKRHVLTERRRKYGEEGSPPRWRPLMSRLLWNAVHVSFPRVCVRLVWTAAKCIYGPYNTEGTKQNRLCEDTDVTLVQSFKVVFQVLFNNLWYYWVNKKGFFYFKIFFPPWSVPLNSTYKLRATQFFKVINLTVQVISTFQHKLKFV